MNEIKYEPLYGLQKPFDNGPADSTAYGLFRDGDEYIYYKIDKTSVYCFDTDNQWSHIDGAPTIPFLAMRRIIAEPKRWTVADQKAGRLPDVGSKAVSVRGFCVVDILAVRNGCVVACNSDVMDSRPCVFTIDNFLELYKPIETPEEKERRARKEWCIKALRYNSQSGSKVEAIYDALLSGELTMPGNGDE